MRWRTFLVYNAAGGILWAIVYGTLGYFAGRFLHDNFAEVERLARTLGWIGAGLVVVGVVAVFVIFRILRARHSQSISRTTEKTESKQAEEKARL
jgi:membrane protein DedA with SNARE-associated domain